MPVVDFSTVAHLPDDTELVLQARVGPRWRELKLLTLRDVRRDRHFPIYKTLDVEEYRILPVAHLVDPLGDPNATVIIGVKPPTPQTRCGLTLDRAERLGLPLFSAEADARRLQHPICQKCRRVWKE